MEVGPISLQAITYENDSSIQSFSSQYDLAIATYWDLIFPLYQNFKRQSILVKETIIPFQTNPKK
ncbi:hypothetical protein F6Y05_33830 [Bacillus megaterium]|nr:hypothetical protein [Priestia megaterium]